MSCFSFFKVLKTLHIVSGSSSVDSDDDDDGGGGGSIPTTFIISKPTTMHPFYYQSCLVFLVQLSKQVM